MAVIGKTAPQRANLFVIEVFAKHAVRRQHPFPQQTHHKPSCLILFDRLPLPGKASRLRTTKLEPWRQESKVPIQPDSIAYACHS